MKVGLVLDDTLDSTDGVQQYMLTVGSWLQKQNVEVHYIVGKTKRQDIENIHSFSKKIPVRFNRNKLTIPLSSSPKKIRALLSKKDFDILHIQMPHSPMLAARVVDMAPKRPGIIGTFHIAPFSKFEQKATRLLGYLLKPNLKRFDKIISVSPAAQKFAKKTFKIDSSVIPNAVNTKQYRPDKGTLKLSERNDFVFVGRLVSRKGCMHLLKAFRLFIKNNPVNDSVKLHICGDGSERKKLERFVNANNLKSHITFHGIVSEKQKVDFLQSARLAIYPSMSGESFGIVLIEAMAAGSGVVLGGDNEGYLSVLGQNSLTAFKPADHSALAKKMEFFMNDTNLNAEHEKQQELVAKFDIENVGPKILNEYESVIAKRQQLAHNNGKGL